MGWRFLARAAQVNDLVTRSINGHLTTAMQHHYSTVSRPEQKDALAKIYNLAHARPAVRIEGLPRLAANDVVAFPTHPTNDTEASKSGGGSISGMAP